MILPQVFMDCAYAFAKQSKCIRLQVGAVIVKDDHIISHGYNGTPSGQPNCCEVNSLESKPDWYTYVVRTCTTHLNNLGLQKHNEFSKANEIHAELNAILFAAKLGLSIDGCTMYCTTSPCQDCAKNIVQSGIKKVIYDKEYDRNPDNWKYIFIGSGVEIKHISEV